ncbi:hypothetical protein BD414DRAFT_488197 [Trametes punicea]|nr:hypothetical protein BD414DRAFT_488197 [Trametes punicea]
MIPIYHTPTPSYPTLGSKFPLEQGSSRSRTPYRPSPGSTPGISDTTSEASESSSVQYDKENLVRTLGLSQQDIDAADVTSWEAPGFTAWITQRSAQEAQVWHFFPNGQQVSSSHVVLNPNAGEFVPSAPRRWVSGAPEVGVDVLQMRFPWMSQFRSGSATTDSNARREDAKAIVHMCRWDGYTIQQLAVKFAERAMEGNGENLLLAAAFAKSILDAIRKYGGPICAAAFRMHLMRNVWIAFEAVWRVGLPTSFLSPGYQCGPSVLSPALAIVSFVGELFSHRLVHPGFVYRCLNLLVSDMFVIEQLRAARVLLCRLDHHLQCADPAAMNAVINAIITHSARIVPGQSVLGEAFNNGDVKAQIDDILAVARRWKRSDPAKVRRAPKESISPFSSDDEMTSRQPPFVSPHLSHASVNKSFVPSHGGTPVLRHADASKPIRK